MIDTCVSAQSHAQVYTSITDSILFERQSTEQNKLYMYIFLIVIHSFVVVTDVFNNNLNS